MFDAIPQALGISEEDWLTRSRLFGVECIVGALLYNITFSKFIPRVPDKLMKFLGLVTICCGLWGILDILVTLSNELLGVKPLYIHSLVFLVTALLGALHHYQYRQDYLLDQLL